MIGKELLSSGTNGRRYRAGIYRSIFLFVKKMSKLTSYRIGITTKVTTKTNHDLLQCFLRIPELEKAKECR